MNTNVQAVNYDVGSGPTSVATADLNKDGHTDIVIANHGAHTISVLLGNSTGTFAPAPNSPYVVGTNPRSVAIGDLNEDGYLDIVTANYGANTVSVLLGNGTGAFAPSPNSPYPVGNVPTSVAIADLNGDGYSDIVTANHLDHTISVLFGNPAGTFSQAPNSQYSVGTNPISIEIGDLNKDGYVDIAVANAGSNLVSVLLGNEAGTFFSAINSPYSVGAGAYSVVIADLNKDGNLDIVTANYRANTVSVLYGTVDGPFS